MDLRFKRSTKRKKKRDATARDNRYGYGFSFIYIVCIDIRYRSDSRDIGELVLDLVSLSGAAQVRNVERL